MHPDDRSPGLRAVLVRSFRNAGFLLSGQAVSGLIGLANLAIAARILGPSDFGALVLVHTYVMLIGALARFQSWQALIRYASDALENDRPRDFQGLVVFTTILDAASGVLAVALACLAAPWVGGWIGWSTDVVPFVMLYAFAAPFLMQGTPNGVLWLFDRFRLQAALFNIAPVVRLIGSLFVLIVGGDLKSLIVVWLVAGLCHGIAPWLAGALTLSKRGLFPERPFLPRGVKRTFPGIWPYVISTNLSSSVKASRNRIAVLLVAGLLGPASGGYYRLAQDIAGVLSRAGLVVGHAVFPEFSRLHSAGSYDFLRRSVRWSGLFGALAGLLFLLLVWFWGEELLSLVAGREFREAAALLVLITAGNAILLVGVSLPPAMLAMGAAQRTLAAQVAVTVVHFIALWWLAPGFGLPGAGYALVLSNALYILLLAVAFLQATRSPPARLNRA